MKKCPTQFISLVFAQRNSDLDHACPQRLQPETFLSLHTTFGFEIPPIGRANHMYTYNMKTIAVDSCIVELIALSTVMHQLAKLPVCNTGPCLLADVSEGTIYQHSSCENMTFCYPFIDEIMKTPVFCMLQNLLTTKKWKKYKILRYSARIQSLPNHNPGKTLSSCVCHPWTIAFADSSLNCLNHRCILSCCTQTCCVNHHSAIPTSHRSKSHSQSKMKAQSLHCNGIRPKKPRQNTLTPNYHINSTHCWELCGVMIHLMLLMIRIMVRILLFPLMMMMIYTCSTKKHKPQTLSCIVPNHVLDLYGYTTDLVFRDSSYDTNHSDNCHKQAAVNLLKYIALLTCAPVATMLWKSPCHCNGKAYSLVRTILNTFDWFSLVVIYIHMWTMATACFRSVNSSTHSAIRTNYPGNCHNRSLVIGCDGGNALPWVCTTLTVIPAIVHYLKIKAFVYSHSMKCFCDGAHNTLKNTNYLGNFHQSLVIGCNHDIVLPSHTIQLYLILVLHIFLDTVITCTTVYGLCTILGQPCGILIGPLFCLLLYQSILKHDTLCTHLTEWAAQLLRFVKNQYQCLKHYVIDLTPWLALYYSCHICIFLAASSNYQLQRKGLGIFHHYAVVIQVILLRVLQKEKTEHLLSLTVYINLERACNGLISGLSTCAAGTCHIIRWGVQIFYIMF